MSKKSRFANRRGVRNKTGIATEELDQARKLKIIIHGYQFMGTIFSHIRVPNPQISGPTISLGLTINEKILLVKGTSKNKIRKFAVDVSIFDDDQKLSYYSKLVNNGPIMNFAYNMSMVQVPFRTDPGLLLYPEKLLRESV